jgi:hypothetical protein
LHHHLSVNGAGDGQRTIVRASEGDSLKEGEGGDFYPKTPRFHGILQDGRKIEERVSQRLPAPSAFACVWEPRLPAANTLRRLNLPVNKPFAMYLPDQP